MSTIKFRFYSVMRVKYAAQVLSETVGNIVNNFASEKATGTERFRLMVDEFFDC